MRKITSHLWFDKEAREAAGFYTSIFKDSRIKNTATLHDTPSGAVDLVSIEVLGQEFTLISAGPLFKFTPAVSFLVACRTKQESEALWGRLSEGGSELMALGEYPFSEKYGWLVDRYGLSWQVVPTGLEELFTDPDPERAQRAMQAMLGMGKLDIAALRSAADGVPAT